MPEDQADANGQAPPANADANGQAPPANNKQTANSQAANDQTFTAADMKDLRAEAAKYRTENKDIAARLKAFEDQGKTDLQKAQEERDALNARATAAESALGAINRRAAIAKALGDTAIYPDAVAALISEADVPTDPKTGQPDAAALAAKITALRGQYPAYFNGSAQGGDAGARGDVPGNVDMNRLLFGRR